MNTSIILDLPTSTGFSDKEPRVRDVVTASYTWPGDALVAEIDRLERRAWAVALQTKELEQEQLDIEEKIEAARAELAKAGGK